MHVSTCLDQPLVASYNDLMMQTLITFFACLVPVFIYDAHVYATSLFHTDYWNWQHLVMFLDEFLAVITGCGGGIFISLF